MDYGLSLSPAMQRWATGLFSQQCWLWGCDIRREASNLLVQYGFERFPRRTPHESSAYQLNVDPNQSIVLWGFGIFAGDVAQGGVYVQRHDFVPVLMEPLGPTAVPALPVQLPTQHAPHTYAEQRRAVEGLHTLLHWIAVYEGWVLANAGLAYREECVALWTRGRFQVPAERIVVEWELLANHYALGLSEP